MITEVCERAETNCALDHQFRIGNVAEELGESAVHEASVLIGSGVDGRERTSGEAPVIAKDLGARRAGQGRGGGERSERTLDAPKSSRTIEHRSDATISAIC